ncbi:MAG TPA: sigma-70 family RNA polymerase sigma factor [Thermoanaerobaculia bacterium]|nr:sigma-70 family RNA polymerase sigma factor [Thermoanaerobaculia bacterium]
MDTSLPETSARPSAGHEEGHLLAELRAGKEAAFERLLRDHGGRMLAVARRLVRDEEDARDAVQEALLAAFRSLDRFEGSSRISTWLHRIVVNACLMRLRSRQRRPEEAIEDLLPRFQENGHQVDHPSREWVEPVDALLQRREICDLVRKSIDRLPETYRTALILRDIEELSTEEAARLLEVSENALKIRLHRARQALRTLLDPHLKEWAAA